MENLRLLVDLLLLLKGKSVEFSETAVNAVFSGDGADLDLLNLFCRLYEVAEQVSLNSIAVHADDDYAGVDTIKEFIEDSYYSAVWKVVVKKECIKTDNNVSDGAVLFFLERDSYEQWSSSFNPLKSKGNLFISSSHVTAFLPGVERPFGGPFISVFPLRGKCDARDDSISHKFPAEELVKEHVHIVPATPMRICPNVFALTWGDRSQVAASIFRRWSSVVLGACLVDVIYDIDKVVIKGVRHIEVPLIGDEVLDASELSYLEAAVSWIFEERVETRKRLLLDRVVLDADKKLSLISILRDNLSDALGQSRDQYKFVILDRKDEYARELKDLLKDLRGQADLYSSKSRMLVSALSRDSLAAFLFAGLSMTARFGREMEIIMSPAAGFFFRALSVYFILSVVMNVGSSVRDLMLSNAELKRWSRVTSDYMSSSQLENYIGEHLGARVVTFGVIAVLVTILYLFLAVISWFLPVIVSALGLFEVNGVSE